MECSGVEWCIDGDRDGGSVSTGGNNGGGLTGVVVASANVE